MKVTVIQIPSEARIVYKTGGEILGKKIKNIKIIITDRSTTYHISYK